MSAKVRNIYDGSQIGILSCVSNTTPQIFPPFTNVIEARTYDNLGSVYDYYYNVFGRDSFDGKGGAINATLHEKKEFRTEGRKIICIFLLFFLFFLIFVVSPFLAEVVRLAV
jgi:hypothetical protein